MPAKHPPPLPRLPATCADGAPVVQYVTRTNSTGGGTPAACDAPEGEWVTVDYTSTYTFYECLAEKDVRRRRK